MGTLSKLLGARIRLLRGTLTQATVATRAGIGRADLSHYETGRHLPPETTLQALAQALGYDVLTLLDFSQSLPLQPWRCPGPSWAEVGQLAAALSPRALLLYAALWDSPGLPPAQLASLAGLIASSLQATEYELTLRGLLKDGHPMPPESLIPPAILAQDAAALDTTATASPEPRRRVLGNGVITASEDLEQDLNTLPAPLQESVKLFLEAALKARQGHKMSRAKARKVMEEIQGIVGQVGVETTVAAISKQLAKQDYDWSRPNLVGYLKFMAGYLAKTSNAGSPGSGRAPFQQDLYSRGQSQMQENLLLEAEARQRRR